MPHALISVHARKAPEVAQALAAETMKAKTRFDRRSDGSIPFSVIDLKAWED